RVGDPGIGLETRAHRGGIEEEKRASRGDAGGGENVLARKLTDTGKLDRGDAEARRIGDGVAAVAKLLGECRDVSAAHYTEGHGAENECNRGSDPNPPRQPP